MQKIKFIDLFCGMGGFRLGFEKAAKDMCLEAVCVFSSDIKPYAVQVYEDNFHNEEVSGDITQIQSDMIPDFDVLLAGFPCQAFSNAGRRQGFLDTRGTLFFEIERILRDKKPKAFILENVEGLITHDRTDRNSPIGNTLRIILESLTKLGYHVSWEVLNGVDFNVPQKRKRVFIVGTLISRISLSFEKRNQPTLSSILEQGKPLLKEKMAKLLLEHFQLSDLYGKSIKDKRGGSNNIHSWEIELKGSTSKEQRELLNRLLRARRNKKWADIKGIQWMDGMPLTVDEIRTFFNHPNLEEMLTDLCEKDYLRLEHPKDIVKYMDENGVERNRREFREDLEKGYNIVTGKLSFDINQILDPDEPAPTLVATDIDRIAVPDNGGLRQLTLIEMKRLFGFPDQFKINVRPREAFDLFGNTVIVPIVEEISKRVIKKITNPDYVNYDKTTPCSSKAYNDTSLPFQIELI